MNAPLLRASGLRQALRRGRRRRRHHDRRRPGERVSLIGSNGAGKTTLRQHDHRLSQARRRPHRASTAATSRALAPRAITRLGVAPLVPDPAALRRPDGARQHARRASPASDQRLSFWQPAHRAGGGRARRALLERFRLARAPRAPRRRAARRREEAARHRDGADRRAQAAAARRADQRRLGRREVPDDGHDHDGARPRADDRALRRARHGHRRALRRAAWSRSTPAASSPTARPRPRSRTDDVRRYVTGELLAE